MRRGPTETDVEAEGFLPASGNEFVDLLGQT